MGRSTSRPAWAVASLATLMAVLCSTAYAFVADTKIAFVSWRDGDSEIYTMNSDGSGMAQLTLNAVSDELWPAWSPDGSEIAFASTRDDGDFDIYVMDAAGQNTVRLTDDAATDWEPAWSPDGTRIAFVSYRTGVGELFVMDVDGFGVTQLSFIADADDGTYDTFAPTWSPDSTQIAYQSIRYDNSDIYVVDADTASEYQLTTDFDWDFWPAWSPDGTMIAFGSWRDGDPEIYTIGPEPGIPTQLTFSAGYDGKPAWSPDSTMIAFETDRDAVDESGDTNIYVMYADGSDQTPLTSDLDRDESPSWSPAIAGDVLIYVVGGTALDDAGAPVDGLTVVVNNASRPELETIGVTDASGVFTVSLFDAVASVVASGDTITLEAYDGEFLVGAAEVVLSETDIDAGVSTVTLDIKLPVQIVLDGVGFDAFPLVDFTQQAAAAAVSATSLSTTDQGILATALETTLLQLVLPGYPNSAPVLYPDYGNALVSGNLGNPMTFARDYLVPDIGNVAGDVPRILGAPLLNVLAMTDADVAGVTMSLAGGAGGADALVLRVATGTLVPYTFVFDSAAALNFLAAWAGGVGVVGSLPVVDAVTVIVEERDASTGAVLNTLSAPLLVMDGDTWATSSPTSLTPGRVVHYVYEVTLAGDVELADGTLVSSWVLPDPYNFQWVDVADGASAIARISQIGPALGLPAEGTVDPTDPALARRFASLMFRELIDSGNVGIASVFQIPEPTEDASYWLGQFDVGELQALPDDDYDLTAEAIDSIGDPAGYTLPIPLKYRRNNVGTVNLSTVSDTLFSNDYFELPYAAVITGSLLSHNGYGLSPTADAAALSFERVDVTPTFVVDVPVDDAGAFRVTLEEGLYLASASAEGHEAVEPFDVFVSPSEPTVSPMEILLVPFLPSVSAVADQEFTEDTTLTIALSVTTGDTAVDFVARSTAPELTLEVAGDQLTITPATNYNTDESGPVEIIVFASDAGSGFAPVLAVGGSVYTTGTLVADGAVVRLTNLDSGESILTGVGTDGSFVTTLGGLLAPIGVVEGAFVVADLYSDSSEADLLGTRVVRIGADDVASGSAMVDITVGRFDPTVEGVRTATFLIAIAGANDAPTIDAISAQTTVEDTSVDVELTVYDVDDATSGSTVDVTVSVAPAAAGAASYDATTSLLTVTPAADYDSSAVITVTASDGLLDSSESFTLTMTPVNDAPVVASFGGSGFTIAEEGTLDVTLELSDADTAIESLIIATTADPATAVTLSYDTATSTLSITGALDYSGEAIVTVTVNDGEFDVSESAILAITAVNDAPVIDTIADQEIAEDTTLTVDLEVSDVDSDVEALTYTVTADAALGDGATAGDFSVDTATQTLTFVPPADFNGVLSTTVEASDGELSGSATFTLTVTAVSDAPVATGQSVEALEDTVIDIDMTLGASDADGDALTFVIDTQPAQGVVELLATGDGIARYTPAAEYAGPDGFTFHVSDGTLDSETGSVEIDVVAVNDPPVVGYAAGTTLATTSGVPVDVTFVITDPDTDTHTLELGAASPVGGTAEQTGDLTVTYTPTASFQGADTFSVTALEVDGETALASEELAVSIVVTLPNFPPTAGPSGPFTTFLNTPTTVVLVGADPEGLPLTYDIVAPPAGGTLAGEGASRVYTPNDGFTGQDSFIYQVSDGVNVSGAALVEVSVEPLPAPIVNEARTLDDIEGLVSDVPVTIQLGGDSPVFVQPQGPSADAEMSAASSAPDIAQTTLNGTVLDVLLLSAGEATVTVSTVTADAADSVSVSFNVLVTAPVEENDPPVVGRITPIVVTEGTEVTVFPSVQDPDDDAVSFEVTSVVQESGRDGDSEPSVTYDAASKSLTVGVADIGGLFAQYTVVLAVTDGINDPVEAQFIVTAESNNEPPAISAPADLVVEVGEDVSIEVTAVDPNEGDEVSISAASQATDSDVRSAVRTSLRDFNTADAAEDAGAFVHTFTFSVPEAIQGKFFTIQWTADDSLESASASTLITVGADVNLPPVIDAIANIEVDEGGSAEATVSASDPEGGEVTLTVDGLPDGATFDAASGTVSWPEISYESAGTHALTVTALDDADQVATSGFSVTVTDVNLAPALVFASLDGGDGEGVLGSIEIQQTVESQFVVKGSDLDGDDVTLGASGVPEWVRFSLVDGATGPELTLAFEAPLGTEDFSFTLSVTDTGQLKTEAEVSAVVTEAPNEAPEFADLLSQTATEEEPFEVTIGVTDPNEDEVTLTVAPQPDGATITKVDDEAFVFVWTPAIGDAQDDPVDFTFTADDGREEGTSTATLMVTVQQGENFPPVVPSPEPVSLLEDEEVLIDLLAGVTDPNEDPLTVDIETEFPADRLVFAADDTTAELTLRPEVGDAGTYTVKFTVRDDREGETARTILVTVLAADGGLGAGFDIAAGYSDPATGTIEDAYTFIAVVVNADETAPESVLLTVDDGNGTTLEGVTMTATGDGDLLTGATYSTELRLGVGEYSMSVLATIGAESATFEGDGPTVNPALIEISDLTAQGSSGQIPVTFTIVNPNPEGSATVTVEYQATDGGAWVAATTLGSLAGLASGGQQVVWDTLIDAPAAKNQAVSLRVVPGTGLAATTSLRLTNVAPAAPTLSAVASSPTEAVTVSGTSDTGEAAVTFLNADGQTLGSSTVGADGTFSANLTLAQGSNRITATATLGLVSEPSSPIEVIVDAIPPVLAVVSPERASTVSSLTPVISASADFGISAGDIDASEIRLNGRPISITFDENTGTFSGTKELVDQRIYLVTFEAKKTNGLSSTLSWTFTVDLTAGDETAPLFVSSSPEGDVASAQEISVVVRDGESGIDPDSVSVTLNGETLAADYLPSDDRGGTATATLAEELPAGDYTVEATFADKAGNAGTGSGTFSVITDVAGASFGTGDSSSAPNQAGNPDANFLAVVNTSPFTIDGAAPKDTEIAFFVNGQIVGVTVATESNTWAFDVPLDGDGEKLIQLQTRDDLGNVSPLSAPVSVLYDTTTPTIGFVTPSVTGNLQPDFTGTVTDGLSGVDPASISIELDGSDSGATLVYDADIGSFSATPDAAFDTGSAVTVRVTASDFAGNESVFTSEVAFDERLADVQAPSLLNPQIDGVRLITGFTPHIRGETATIQFGVTDDLSGVASVIGTLNGEDIAFTIAGDIATLEISDIQPDFHNVLLVRATDNRGNEGDIRLFEFERDAATDAFTLDVPSITNETDFVITGSGIEKGASVTVFVNETPTPAFVEGTTFRTSAVRLREGANSVAATATDEVGNTADADPIDVRLDTVAPQVAFVDPVADSVVLATTQTIRARVSDLNGIDPDSVLLLIDEVAVAATVNVDGGVEFTAPEPFAASDTEEPLRHFASITVQDLAGNATSLGIPFFVDGVAPTIAEPIPVDGEVVQTLEPELAATVEGRDFDASTIEVLFGIDGSALASVVDDPNFEFIATNGQVRYWPLLDDGETYRTIIRIRDRAGNQGELQWTFDVATDQEDDTDPSITILFPQPGQSVDDTGLDMLSFSVGDAAGVDPTGVYLTINGSEPQKLGQLEDAGIAEFDRRTGIVRLFGRKIFAPYQGSRGGFSFDPLELNALERSLTGGDNASFDPLELNALERSIGGGGEASFDPLELNALERSLGGGDAGGAAAASLERGLNTSPGALGMGGNSIGIQVADLSGNVSFATWSFSVSLVPPPAPAFDNAQSSSNTSTIRVAGKVPGLDGSGSLPITVALRTNGVSSGITTVTDATGGFVFESVQITPGDNALTATAQDNAGNLSDRSDTLNVVQDVVAPTVQLDPIASSISHASFFMSGSVSDNRDGDLASVTLIINGAETSLPTRQGVFSQTVTVGGGSSTILVRAVDGAGNSSDSPTFTVAFDSDPPTTAPPSLSTSATPDSRGLLLTWTPDANAGAYNVYRSTTPFTDGSALTPIATAVATTSYSDTTVLQGRTFYYAVSSADTAGNTDASILSPTINAALIGGRGGSASLADGTRLSVTPLGLFANGLLTGAVEIGEPTGLTSLDNAVAGTARELTIRTATRQVLTSFNRAATLSVPVPGESEFTADSPTIYQLVGFGWEEVATTRTSSTRTVSANVSTSGTFQVAETAPGPELPPWDVNGDGSVTIIDLVSVATLFGKPAPAGSRADTNGDGVISIIDVVTVATHFGEQTSLSAPALTQPSSVRATLSLHVGLTDETTGLTEVQLRGITAVELAGYEFQVSTKGGAFELDHVAAGDVLGDSAFWMDPRVSSDGMHMAAVRLDMADRAPDGSSTGVLARLFVRVDDAETLADSLRLTDVRLSDREGELFGYRFGRPTIVHPTYDTSLLPNYPNPFNPETWIPFSLSTDSEVTVEVYRLDGTLVRTIGLGLMEAGEYTSRDDAVHWDGRNDTGERVASGVYFYRLVAGSYSEARRLVILK